jgi:hypothetical protein
LGAWRCCVCDVDGVRDAGNALSLLVDSTFFWFLSTSTSRAFCVQHILVESHTARSTTRETERNIVTSLYSQLRGGIVAMMVGELG